MLQAKMPPEWNEKLNWFGFEWNDGRRHSSLFLLGWEEFGLIPKTKLRLQVHSNSNPTSVKLFRKVKLLAKEKNEFMLRWKLGIVSNSLQAN